MRFESSPLCVNRARISLTRVELAPISRLPHNFPLRTYLVNPVTGRASGLSRGVSLMVNLHQRAFKGLGEGFQAEGFLDDQALDLGQVLSQSLFT